MGDDSVFCSQCGAPNPPGGSFCQKCGAAMALQASAPAMVSSATSYPQATVSSGAAAGYGGFWIRFVAVIIDAIILSIALFPIRLLVFAVMHVRPYRMGPVYDGNFGPIVAALPALWGLNTLAGWLYEALTTSSAWQATLGKRILNLKVTDEAGNRISFARATGRHVAKYLSAVIFFIGFIMAAFTERKRALHDMLAGTLVRKTST